MRRKNRRLPRIEALESRALLAGLNSVAAPVMPLGNVLNGKTIGTYATLSASKAGNTITFNGSGPLGALGGFHLVGVVDGVGGAHGETGQIGIWNTRGAILLKVTGQPSTGPLHYSIVKGTRAFANATGAGDVVLTGLSTAHATGKVSVTIEPTPPPPPTTSVPPTGIHITIDLGPTTPVQYPGQTGTAPFAGAAVQIQPAGGGSAIAQGTTDSSGNFSVDLAPGTYLVVAMAPALYPGGAVPAPQLITVVANQMANVTFDYDTGMR